MCGYKDQRSLEFEFNLIDYGIERAIRIDKAEWGEEPNETLAEVSLSTPNVGGIGDYFVIHTQDIEGNYMKWWSQFGMKMPLTPSKKIMYYNARIEKLEEYYQSKFETGMVSRFGSIALSDFQNQPCVVFVNCFFEFDKKYNTAYYKIERKDGKLIPLAGFFGTRDYDEMETGIAHCLVTRDPYPAIERIGHHRSPVILKPENVYDWLNPDSSFQERLDMVSQVDEVEYMFDMVNSKSVTKRTEEAREPLDVNGTIYSRLLYRL